MPFQRPTLSGTLAPTPQPPPPPLAGHTLPPQPPRPFQPRLLILDKRVTGFAFLDDRKQMASLQGYPVPLNPTVEPITAFGTEHTGDKYFTCYGVVDQAAALQVQMPRLTKGVLPLMVQAGVIASTQQVVGTALAIDFDLPEHAKWTPATLAFFTTVFAAVGVRFPLFAKPTLWYATAGGCRYVWLLSRPVPVEGPGGLGDLLAGLVAAAHHAGLPADPACRDWTRLFRLPRVQREDKPPQEARTQDQPYFRMSWGRVDTTAKEMVPPPGPLTHSDPVEFPQLSNMTPDQFKVNESSQALARLWERSIGRVPVAFDGGHAQEQLGPAPDDGEVSRQVTDADGAESVPLRMIKRVIESEAFPKKKNKAPYPAAVQAWEYLEGKRSLYQIPEKLEGLHQGILVLTQTLCLCIRERLGETPGQISPRLIFAVVFQRAQAANAQRSPEQQRSSEDLRREVWGVVTHTYTRHRFLAQQDENETADLDANKIVQAAGLRAVDDAIKAAIKAQLMEWAIDSIPGERERAHERAAAAASGREDHSTLTTIEQWIDEHWKSVLVLSIPREGKAILKCTPAGQITYSQIAYDEGSTLAAIRDCGHDLIATEELTMAANQAPRIKPITKLMSEYGTQANMRLSRLIKRPGLRLIAEDNELSIQLVVKAPGIRTDIRAIYDPLVDEWLRCLGGSQAEKLLDWLAGFPQLDKPIAGLYLEGPPDVGKGMLGKALENLTASRSHAPFCQVIESFQDTMLKTPFVWADEESGSSQRSTRSVMNMFKKLITGEVSTLNAKNKTMTEVDGNWRVLFTANNGRLLDPDDDINENDKGALVQRLIHIDVGPEAAHYLRALGGKAGTVGWPERAIPQHVIWLQQNRVVVPGSRLFVEGIRTAYHDGLSVNTVRTDAVVRALGRILSEPAKYPAVLKIVNGEVLINTASLHGALEVMYGGTSTKVPPPRSVIQSVRTLSSAKHPKSVRMNNIAGNKISTVVKAWPLNLKQVIEALEITGNDADIRAGIGEELWQANASQQLQKEVRDALADAAPKKVLKPIQFQPGFGSRPPMPPPMSPSMPPPMQAVKD